jgi:hypothetical protein
MNEIVVDQVTAAVADQGTPPEERALVKQWERTLMHARKGDKPFRECVIRDRKFATGEALAGYEVSTNLVQATIDTLIPFLYAKDPDVDVVPADQVPPPVKQRPQPPQPPGPTVDPATGQPMMAPDGMPISPDPQALMQYQMEMAQFQAQQAQEQAEAEQIRQQNDFIRRLAATIEIVITKLWHKGKLKAGAKQWLRAGMTSAEGWLKVSLQGDLATDPTVQKELATLQEQLAQIEVLKAQIEDGECHDYDAAMADLQAKIDGAQARVETYVARCLAVDWIDTLDFQSPLSLRTMSEYPNSPWLADATYYTVADACARFKLDKARLAHATTWKPPQTENYGSQQPTEGGYAGTDGEVWTRQADKEASGFVRCWEINSRHDNMVFTWIEGTDLWAKAPAPPRFATTRFYPYFLLALYECDATRHPQSLAWRLSKLQEEYAITRSNFAEVRRRAKPGVLVDGTNIEPGDMDKVQQSGNQEFTVVNPVRPGEPLSNSFAPKPHNSVEPGLYDTQPIRADMETISGAQEALTSGVQVAKTATEAEIQQSGFGARSGYSRDCLDMALDDLAQYTAELALEAFTPEQVRQMAGPHAVWPQGIEKDKLESLLYVAIRAGSTGKPNTTAERQAWSAILPQLQAMIGQIGQAVGADPREMADKLTELLRETVMRAGDRIDVDRFLPMASPGAQAGMATMQAPPGVGSPQTGQPMPQPIQAPPMAIPPPETVQ